MLPQTADIIIIGGGVMGVSAAYHLARRQAGRILLLERDIMFGLGATGTCAGGIRHQFSTAVDIQLSIASIQMLERFSEEMEQDVDLHQVGYLYLLSSHEQMADFEGNVALQRSLGIETEILNRDEIARRAPLLDLDADPLILGGTYYHRDGHADPYSVVEGYVKQARRLGAELRTDVRVNDIQVEGGKTVGVETDQGRVASPTVLLTAGPWSGPIAQTAGIDLPVVPLRRQIAVTRPLDISRDMPLLVDFAQRLYFRNETGGILTTMSNPNETPGVKLDVDQNWALHHFDRAIARMPILAEAELLTQWAGLHEITPDRHPIVGPLPVGGLYACTGFSGHGFMQGAVCGLLMAEDILDGGAHTMDITPLRFDRFAANELAPKNVV